MGLVARSKRAAIPAALLLLGGAAGAVWWSGARQREEAATGSEQLEIVTTGGVRSFLVEVARTPEQQARGLMFRTELAPDRGMLFPHEVPREASMWMRNTYIPLDMVFIRPDGIVHRIAANTEPLSEELISSGAPVAAVLELAGGATQRLGIKPGDEVRYAPLFGKAASH